MAEALDLSNLAASANDYYREHNTNIHNELNIGLFDGLHNISDRMTLMSDVMDELVLTGDFVDDFIHQHVPAQKGSFNPTANAIGVKPRILKTRKYEGDLKFADDDLQVTYLQYLAAKKMGVKNQAGEVPSFIDYLFGNSIISKGQRTLRKSLIKASYDGTAPRSWAKILNGLETVVVDEVNAGNIVPVTISSAFSTTNVITHIESVFDELGTAYQKADDVVVLVSSNVYKLYARANRSTLGRYDKFDSTVASTIDGYSNAVILEEPDFEANQILAYRKSNLCVGFDTNAITPWEFQRQDRFTKMMLNGKIGLQFKAVNNDASNLNVVYGSYGSPLS
jgi:hypothetical protein